MFIAGNTSAQVPPKLSWLLKYMNVLLHLSTEHVLRVSRETLTNFKV